MSIEPKDPALSKLRVARACFLGVRECLVDAEDFVQRGMKALEDAAALMVAGEKAETNAPARRPGRSRKRRKSAKSTRPSD